MVALSLPGSSVAFTTKTLAPADCVATRSGPAHFFTPLPPGSVHAKLGTTTCCFGGAVLAGDDVRRAGAAVLKHETEPLRVSRVRRANFKGDSPMANSDEFFDLLRSDGLRKKVAKPLAKLEGNSRRSGAAGEKLARQTVDDLKSAIDEIRSRVLKRDRTRTQGARKAAQTRKRKGAKRAASARRGASTRGKVAQTRARAKKQSKSRR